MICFTNRARLRAFTIVEMLVAIAIVGILLTLLSGAMARSRDYAKRSLCQNNLRQVVIGWSSYPSDNNNRIPYGMPDDAQGWVRTGAGTDPIRRGKIFPYVGDTDVFACPSDTVGNTRSFSIVAPMHGERWNRHLTHPNDSWIQVGTDNFTEIIFPEKQMVILEELDTRGWNIGSWIMYARKSRKWSWIDFMANFHGDGTSISFADGHVEYWYWQDKDTLYASRHGQFYLNDAGNEDWLRVRNHYRQLADYPDVPQKVEP